MPAPAPPLSDIARGAPPFAGPADALALFAHPDDETFGPGGTLALLAAAGRRIALHCATRGESGTIGSSPLLGRRRLGAIREGELHDACRELGIETPAVYCLPDGGLARLDPETLLRPFVRAIRLHRPRLLVTFHRGGVSGHADHRTVTLRTVEAFALAADGACWPELGPPHGAERVWGYSVRASRAARVTWRRLEAVADDAVDALVDATPFLERKMAAVAAHATQKPFVDQLAERLGGIETYWGEEAFTLEATRAPLPAAPRPLDDLFAGLDSGPARP